MNKEIIKDIYDFVFEENIPSFHCVAFGILPHITLDQLRSTQIEPILHIVLNSAKTSYIKDKLKLSKRFIDIPIIYENHDSSLWVDL
jgi:hypothetical protein